MLLIKVSGRLWQKWFISRASPSGRTRANARTSDCLHARGKLITANQIKQRHQITLSICESRGPNKKFIKKKEVERAGEWSVEEERQRLAGEGDSIRELTRRVRKGKSAFEVRRKTLRFDYPQSLA